MINFEDRSGIALVTGGTGGIGSEVCRVLAEHGAKVVFSYRRNEEAAAALASEIMDLGGDCSYSQLDVADNLATSQFVDATLSQHGQIHTVVHAAGPHVPMKHLSTIHPDDFAKQIHEDLAGAFNVISACLPALRETSGAIVAVTTAATRRYPVRDGLSSSPKGGVEALCRAFAAEEGRFGVRVNCVGPGMVTDGMALRLQESGDLDQPTLEKMMRNIPLRRFGSASDIAQAVIFLASDQSAYVTGQKLDVDGGYGV